MNFTPTNTEFEEKLARLCAFPRATQAVSVLAAARESGFESMRDALNVRELADYLRARPHLIADWLAYSQDKRTSEGWYFRAPMSVGRIVVEPPPTRELKYHDAAAACAAFIVAELSSVLDRGGAT